MVRLNFLKRGLPTTQTTGPSGLTPESKRLKGSNLTLAGSWRCTAGRSSPATTNGAWSADWKYSSVRLRLQSGTSTVRSSSLAALLLILLLTGSGPNHEPD